MPTPIPFIDPALWRVLLNWIDDKAVPMMPSIRAHKTDVNKTLRTIFFLLSKERSHQLLCCLCRLGILSRANETQKNRTLGIGDYLSFAAPLLLFGAALAFGAFDHAKWKKEVGKVKAESKTWSAI